MCGVRSSVRSTRSRTAGRPDRRGASAIRQLQQGSGTKAYLTQPTRRTGRRLLRHGQFFEHPGKSGSRPRAEPEEEPVGQRDSPASPGRRVDHPVLDARAARIGRHAVLAAVPPAALDREEPAFGVDLRPHRVATPGHPAPHRLEHLDRRPRDDSRRLRKRFHPRGSETRVFWNAVISHSPSSSTSTKLTVDSRPSSVVSAPVSDEPPPTTTTATSGRTNRTFADAPSRPVSLAPFSGPSKRARCELSIASRPGKLSPKNVT